MSTCAIPSSTTIIDRPTSLRRSGNAVSGRLVSRAEGLGDRVRDFARAVGLDTLFDVAKVPREQAIAEDALDPIGKIVTAEMAGQALRPPLTQERLHQTSEGEIWLTLRHRWADGTTHLRFDPLELLERLAVLTPRPRVNLILYYGVLAPRAAWPAALVPATSRDVVVSAGEASVEPDEDAARGAKPSQAGGYQWAELMRRPFGVDVLACPRCGGRLRLVALIVQASVIQRILRHLGLPTDVAAPRPARAPPRERNPTEDQSREAPEFDAAW